MDVSTLKAWIQESGVKIGHLEMEVKGLKEQNELLRLENNSLKSEIRTFKKSKSKSKSDAFTETDHHVRLSNKDNDDSGIEANKLETILINTYQTLINRKRQRYHSDDKIDEERNELESATSNTHISAAVGECTNEELIHENGTEVEGNRFLQPSGVQVEKRKVTTPSSLSISASTSEFIPDVSKRTKQVRLDSKEGQISNSNKGGSSRKAICAAKEQIEKFKFKEPGFGQSATIWGKIQVDEPVYARRINKSYHSGRITQKGLHNTWYIHFDNHMKDVVFEGHILPIKILGHGIRAVYYPNNSFTSEEVIVVGQKLMDPVDKVEYAVISEVDGRRIYCFRKNLTLKETFAKVLLRNNMKRIRTEQNFGVSDNK